MRTNECLFIFVCVMHVNTLSIPQMGAYCVFVWILVKFGKGEGKNEEELFKDGQPRWWASISAP